MAALADKNLEDSTLECPVSQGNLLMACQEVRCVSTWQDFKDFQFIRELSTRLRLPKGSANRQHGDFRSEELEPAHSGTETIYHRSLSSLAADDSPGRIRKRPHAHEAAVSGFRGLLAPQGMGRSRALRRCGAALPLPLTIT